MATSVPVAIAMPTSAAASAGASLMPSPTIATTCPLPRSALDRVRLVVRQHLGRDLVDAQPVADRAARRPRPSPVSMTVPMPRLLAAASTAAARMPSTVSPNASRPSTRGSGAVSASQETVRPAPSSSRGLAPRAAPTTPSSCIRRALPSTSRRPSTSADTPRPGSARKSVAAGRREAVRRSTGAHGPRQRMFARRPAAPPPAGASPRARRPHRAGRPGDAGRPSVSVPVLSKRPPW